ncbi:hypothetical protein HAX54_045578, partial [Datura stramonium]|nr:hypothetical protein [Datura stramonium]
VPFPLQRTDYSGQKAAKADLVVIPLVRYDGLRPSPRSRCNEKSTSTVVPRISSS